MSNPNNSVSRVDLQPLVRRFVLNVSGVHLHSGLADRTLCGEPIEGNFGEEADGTNDICVPTKERVVSCPTCCAIIAMTRGVKCLPNDKDLARRALDSE